MVIGIGLGQEKNPCSVEICCDLIGYVTICDELSGPVAQCLSKNDPRAGMGSYEYQIVFTDAGDLL